MRMSEEFKALKGFVLARDEKEVLSTLLAIPDEARVNMTGIGRIVSVAEGSHLQVGDRILYHMYEVEFFKDGDDFIAVVPEDEVKCLLDPTFTGKLKHRKYGKVADPLTSPLALYNRAQAQNKVAETRSRYEDALTSRFST